MEEEQKIWQSALGELELTLSKANFTTWLKNTFISSYEKDAVTIGVPNIFTKAWLEKKYHLAILKALQKITGNRVRTIFYRVETRVRDKNKEADGGLAEEKTDAFSLPAESINLNEFGLNPRYNFANFVIGKGNELAQAASLAVAKQPGDVYNPLFIYGGVGLGKTHLVQAIGNQILRLHPEKKILYVSCEKFTNDFIKSISSNRCDKFKNTYRSLDILLIDDIQFLAGKDGTQEEFFHTFNELHQANKQLVLTSDRPPKAIPALESRLTSRFEWVMIADIALPDLETRSAILKSKCLEKNCLLDDEIVSYIATNIQNNVRELEGALNKIIAIHQLNAAAPTLESIKRILSSIASVQRKRSVTPRQIINLVAEFYDIKLDDLLGECRKKELSLPRQIAMFLMREELKSSYPAIGHEIGRRDNTTAMHAYLKIVSAIDSDEKVNQDIKLLRERLYN